MYGNVIGNAAGFGTDGPASVSETHHAAWHSCWKRKWQETVLFSLSGVATEEADNRRGERAIR